MKAFLIAVGSELLAEGHPDTLGGYLTGQLEGIGWRVTGRRIVPDDAAQISKAILEGRGPDQAVLLTGGLGPTRDDQTREGIAQSLEKALRLDGEAQRQIRSWCRLRKVPYGPQQRRQALFPLGAKVIRNRIGSAPGIWYRGREGFLISLPGVPAELRAMLVSLLPRLRRLGSPPRPEAELVITGIGESEIDRRLARWSRSWPEMEVTPLAKPGEVRVRLKAPRRGASRRLDSLIARARTELGVNLVSWEGESLEEVVLHLLRKRGVTLATAESCTAGLIAARLASIPGASSSFVGGAICYNAHCKSAILSIPREILKKHGEVSRPTSLAMARGVTRLTGADLGVAVTGVAGPSGGSSMKPVGTVHLALHGLGRASSRKFQMVGDRETIRWRSSTLALDLVRRRLLESPGAPSRRRRK